jgi:hypothetical protein
VCRVFTDAADRRSWSDGFRDDVSFGALERAMVGEEGPSERRQATGGVRASGGSVTALPAQKAQRVGDLGESSGSRRTFGGEADAAKSRFISVRARGANYLLELESRRSALMPSGAASASWRCTPAETCR